MNRAVTAIFKKSAACFNLSVHTQGSTGRLSLDGHALEPCAGRGGVGGGGGTVVVSAPQTRPSPLVLGIKPDPERVEGFHIAVEEPVSQGIVIYYPREMSSRLSLLL